MNINISNIIPAGNKRSRKPGGVAGVFVPEAGKNTELVPDAAAELLEMVQKARNEWLDATMSFEHVSEEELVDYFTYKMKACESRYAYFLKKAKEQGMKVDC